MTDKPKRPILHLKFPPSTPVGGPAAHVASVAPPAAKAMTWKCKPCGKPFQVLAELADEDSVRCPACNARLGLAADFRSDPPNLEKVRARLAAEPPPKPPTSPRPPGPRSSSPRVFVRGSIGSRRER
jgi:DNA-directed RNA polymerase subunit RPC12/RpoP